MALFEVLELPTNQQNYSIKDNKAYTEDNVLVYNIFIYSIPRKLREDVVRKYFSQFGTVRTVRLVSAKKRSRRAAPKVGFVNFVEPVSAAKALMKQHHRLQGQRVGVKASDSWNQPFAEKACSHVDVFNIDPISKTVELRNIAPNNDDIDKENLNVLSLNDDCLEHICRFLNLRDQIRFARVCQRFHNVFQMFCKREYKNFTVDRMMCMTLWESRDFFRFVGAHIETIVGNIPYKNRERVVEFISNFCINLKCLSLDDSKMRLECLRKLLKGLQNLKELNLQDCSLNDHSIQALYQLPTLEILGLSENYELTGRYLKNLEQLKSLNLYGCSNIQSTHLIDVCKSLKGLKSLDLRRCERVNVALFDAMVTYCQQLEVLKISCPDIPFESVAQLPSLKQLELWRCSFALGISRTQIFGDLVKYKSNQLESLRIVAKNTLTTERIELISQLKKLKTLFLASNQVVNDAALKKFSQLKELQEIIIKNCPDITNEGVLALVGNCKNLRHINVQNCSKVTSELIFEALKILKQRLDTSNGPIVFLVHGTSITECALLHVPEYNAAVKASLLRVAFGALTVEIGVDDHIDIYDMWDRDGLFPEDLDDEDYLEEDDDDDDDAFFIPDSDMDDDDIDLAHDMFGHIYPYGLDVYDVIW